MINRISNLKPPESASHAAMEYLQQAGDKLKSGLSLTSLEATARKRPEIFLAVGLAAGVLLGIWVKRR